MGEENADKQVDPSSDGLPTVPAVFLGFQRIDETHEFGGNNASAWSCDHSGNVVY